MTVFDGETECQLHQSVLMEPEDLIRGCQQREVNALRQLYEMYGKSMHGVIFNIVRDHAIADEVLQDVFLKVWNHADSYNARKGRVFTWIVNISRHAAIDKIRTRDYKQSGATTDVQNFTDVIASGDSLDIQTNAIGLKSFVNALQDSCIQVIELLFFRGFTQKEAAELLDIPLGTIKTRSRNCIDQLRKMVSSTQA